MSEGESLCPNAVAEAVIEQYKSLPAKECPGRPQRGESTVLAGIVLSAPGAGGGPQLTVVSLGTGTGCVPGKLLPPGGTAVADGHAETLARRGFARWLLGQADEWAAGKETPFELAPTGRLGLRRGCALHLYSSQPPCGDACIRGRAAPAAAEPEAKRRRVEGDGGQDGGGYATGARLVYSGEDRPAGVFMFAPYSTTGTLFREDAGDGEVGACRSKPGRGAGARETAAVSMSCSDKLARSAFLGLQGALLGCLFEPLAPLSYALGGGACPDAGERALLRRGPGDLLEPKARVRVATVPCPFDPPADVPAADRRMCGYSTGWSRGSGGAAVVSCTGHSAGATKKQVARGKGQSPLSSRRMVSDLLALLRRLKTQESARPLAMAAALLDASAAEGGVSYAELKKAAAEIGQTSARRKAFFESGPFRCWVRKDSAYRAWPVA